MCRSLGTQSSGQAGSWGTKRLQGPQASSCNLHRTTVPPSRSEISPGWYQRFLIFAGPSPPGSIPLHPESLGLTLNSTSWPSRASPLTLWVSRSFQAERSVEIVINDHPLQVPLPLWLPTPYRLTTWDWVLLLETKGAPPSEAGNRVWLPDWEIPRTWRTSKDALSEPSFPTSPSPFPRLLPHSSRNVLYVSVLSVFASHCQFSLVKQKT